MFISITRGFGTEANKTIVGGLPITDGGATKRKWIVSNSFNCAYLSRKAEILWPIFDCYIWCCLVYTILHSY